MNRLPIALLFVLGPAIASAQLRGVTVLQGPNNSIQYSVDPVSTGYAYVVRQFGTVHTFIKGRPAGLFLQIPTGHLTAGGEQGLLGMAFAPNYASTGHVYVHFNDQNGSTQISRFTKVGSALDYSTRYDIINIPQPFTNHNGGAIHFGPDGNLYMGMGDGGSGYDPGNRAQDPNELLGKFLRIDPTGDDFPFDATRNYSIPTTNPFYGNDGLGARDEIWSFGWRNPYKWSFDSFGASATNALIVGDVGQSAREELDYEPAGMGGRNYGWVVKEGTLFTGRGTAAFYPLIDPAHEYDRTVGTVIIGGRFYRGTKLPSFYRGRYFFADFAFSRIWSCTFKVSTSGLARATTPVEHTAELQPTGLIASIDIDTSGELYVTQYDGRVFRISPP